MRGHSGPHVDGAAVINVEEAFNLSEAVRRVEADLLERVRTEIALRAREAVLLGKMGSPSALPAKAQPGRNRSERRAFSRR